VCYEFYRYFNFAKYTKYVIKTTYKYLCKGKGKGKDKGKGKAIPLQAWTDPEGSRRLRLPDFETIGT